MTRTHTLPTGTMSQPLGSMRTDSAPDLVAPARPMLVFKDPHDILETHLEFFKPFQGRVASAMAFTIDKAVLRTAKAALYKGWDEQKMVEDNPTTFNMFLFGIKEAFTHDSLYEDEGTLRTLAMLMSVRERWHDHAGSLIGLAYGPKSLKYQLKEEIAQNLSNAKDMKPELLEVHRINAQFWADGSEEEQKQFLADITESEKATALHYAMSDKQIEAAIGEIISCASRQMQRSWTFESLPASSAVSLLTSMIGSVRKLAIKESKRMIGKPIEHARLNMHARRVCDSIETTIRIVYPDVGELENCASMSQDQIDLARAKKRAAWNSYD